MVEHLKSKSTQPRSVTTCPILYCEFQISWLGCIISLSYRSWWFGWARRRALSRARPRTRRGCAPSGTLPSSRTTTSQSSWLRRRRRRAWKKSSGDPSPETILWEDYEFIKLIVLCIWINVYGHCVKLKFHFKISSQTGCVILCSG